MKKLITGALLAVLLYASNVHAYNGLVHSASEGLTGTGGDSLDEISCTDSDGAGHDLATGDIAITTDPSGSAWYMHIFDGTSSAAESSPNVIVPNDSVANCSDTGRWIIAFDSSAQISGSPSPYQWALFQNATTIQGIAVTGSSVICTDANGSPEACTSIDVSEINLPTSTASPGTTTGQIKHDSDATNYTNGAVQWYDGNNVRQVIDMVAATAQGCTDDYVAAYDADADLWYCKEDSGVGSAITVSDSMPFNFSAPTYDGNNCAAPTAVLFNSGPREYSIVCADSDSSRFDISAPLPGWDGNAITITFIYIQTASEADKYVNFDVDCQARGQGEASDSTYSSPAVEVNSAQSSTAYANNFVTSGNISPNCTTSCQAGDKLSCRVIIDATSSTATMASVHFIDGVINYTRVLTVQ